MLSEYTTCEGFAVSQINTNFVAFAKKIGNQNGMYKVLIDELSATYKQIETHYEQLSVLFENISVTYESLHKLSKKTKEVIS